MIVAVILTFVVAVIALVRTVFAEINAEQSAAELREAAARAQLELQGRIDSLAREIDGFSCRLNREREDRQKQAARLEADFDRHRTRMAEAFTEGA